jgi:hypothetical protein
VMGKMDRSREKPDQEYRSPSRLDIKRGKFPSPTVSDGKDRASPVQGRAYSANRDEVKRED